MTGMADESGLNAIAERWVKSSPDEVCHHSGDGHRYARWGQSVISYDEEREPIPAVYSSEWNGVGEVEFGADHTWRLTLDEAEAFIARLQNAIAYERARTDSGVELDGVVSGDLADGPGPDPNAVDMRQILPGHEMRDLIATVRHVLARASEAGADPAMSVAHFLAHRFAKQGNELADARVQLGQAGTALAESLASSMQLTAHLVWLREVAGRRHGAAERLRAELWRALPEAEQFRTLTRQGCAAGVHTHWYAPSGGRHWQCPWCLVPTELGEHLARLAEALGIEAAEDDVDMYAAVAALQVEVDRLRAEVAGQPGYAERHRDCVTIGGGYCVDAHADDDPERCPAGDPECDSQIVHDGCRTPSTQALVDVECPAHGPHPHAQMKCLDCPECVS